MRAFRLLSIIAAVLLLAVSARAATHGAGDLEVAAFYNSFAPNVGGMSQLGGRVRIHRLEFDGMYLSGTPAAALAYAYRFDFSDYFVPRFKLGGAYAFSAGNIVSGVGLSFPLIPLFGARLGVAFDMDVYWTYLGSGARFMVTPVYPLSLILTF